MGPTHAISLLTGLFAALVWARPVAAATTRPATVTEATDFSQKLEETLNDGNGELLNRAMDSQAVVERATADLDLPVAVKRKLAALDICSNQGDLLVSQWGPLGACRFLRVRQTNGATEALFRFTTIEPLSANYLGFQLVRGDLGVRVTDVAIWAGGQRLSQTLRWRLLDAAAKLDPDSIAALGGADSERVRRLEEVKLMTSLFKAGKYAQAMETYQTLPQILRTEQSVLYDRLLGSAAASDEQYLKAWDDYFKTYPDQRNSLMAFAGLLLRKQYDDLLAAVDRLDRELGGDPHLNAVRSRALRGKGNLDAARRRMEEGLAKEPKLRTLLAESIDLALEQKEWSTVARRLDEFEESGVELADLTQVPAYAEFVRTEEYRVWWARRAK